jgi:hypothetical protein
MRCCAVLQVCAVTQGGAFAEEVVVPAAAAWHISGECWHVVDTGRHQY